MAVKFASLLLVGLLAAGPALAQSGQNGGTSGPSGTGGGGGGGVSSFSFTNANGVAGTVGSPTTAPNLTLSLGAITPTTVNGNTVPTASDTVALLAATQTLSAKTLASPIISTAATFSFLTGSTQCLQVNTSGVLSGTGSACGSGSTTITAGSTPTSGITSGNLISTTTNVVQDSGLAVNSVVTLTGTQTLSNKTLVAPALGTPVSGVGTNLTGTAAGLTAGNVTTNANLTGDVTSSGNATTLATVNSNTGAIGSATQCVTVTNNAKGLTTAVTAATCTPAIGSITGLGTGVAAQLANAVSTAGGSTQTIARGTLVLSTTAIASGACSAAQTATATNTATTDVVNVSFNGDPTAVTGYAPSTSGGLSIIPYPSANTANIKVCNNTAASITPGAITLNWQVVR